MTTRQDNPDPGLRRYQKKSLLRSDRYQLLFWQSVKLPPEKYPVRSREKDFGQEPVPAMHWQFLQIKSWSFPYTHVFRLPEPDESELHELVRGSE